jgi:hypothetical protein
VSVAVVVCRRGLFSDDEALPPSDLHRRCPSRWFGSLRRVHSGHNRHHLVIHLCPFFCLRLRLQLRLCIDIHKAAAAIVAVTRNTPHYEHYHYSRHAADNVHQDITRDGETDG